MRTLLLLGLSVLSGSLPLASTAEEVLATCTAKVPAGSEYTTQLSVEDGTSRLHLQKFLSSGFERFLDRRFRPTVGLGADDRSVDGKFSSARVEASVAEGGEKLALKDI